MESIKEYKILENLIYENKKDDELTETEIEKYKKQFLEINKENFNIFVNKSEFNRKLDICKTEEQRKLLSNCGTYQMFFDFYCEINGFESFNIKNNFTLMKLMHENYKFAKQPDLLVINEQRINELIRKHNDSKRNS